MGGVFGLQKKPQNHHLPKHPKYCVLIDFTDDVIKVSSSKPWSQGHFDDSDTVTVLYTLLMNSNCDSRKLRCCPHFLLLHVVLWVRESALFPPRRKPTMHWIKHSCPLTCGFLRSGHAPVTVLVGSVRSVLIYRAVQWSLNYACILITSDKVNN